MKRALFFIVTLCICIQPTFAVDNSWSEGADINNDGIVDYKDFAIMAKSWLVSAPIDITWVDINDPGIGDGHEGFVGQMSKYETTNAQYCEYLNAAKNDGLIVVYNDTVYAANDTSYLSPYFYTYSTFNHDYSQITYSDGTFSVRIRDGYDMSNHPVVMVSLNGASTFCYYYGYRLPTEWEWQAVADFDGSYTYGCGTTIDHGKANYEWNNPLGLSSLPYTTPVNYYLSYGYGMNDMAGNVWEWTINNVPTVNFVIRGGGWSYDVSLCTVSARRDSSLQYIHCETGFRVCR